MFNQPVSMLRVCVGCLFVMVGVSSLGCDANPAHYPVAGRVMLDGDPVTRGEVIFTSLDGEPPDAGPIVDGHFEFQSLPGTMRVEITAVRPHPTRKVPGGTPHTWMPAMVNFIPDRYRGPTSELRIEVPRGGNQQILFDLYTGDHDDRPGKGP